MEKMISQGAEAKIFLTENNTIKKVRVKKNYRIKEIDDTLIKTRNKREKKIYDRLPVSHPKLIDSGDDFIEMEYIDGKVLKDVFDIKYCKKIGEMIAQMHDADIIHGDLTTSNIILKEGVIYFIDFGLSVFSKKIEDRAVDLHLLYRSLESKHHHLYEEAFKEILKGYNKSKDFKETMIRFDEVEKRGRNKH